MTGSDSDLPGEVVALIHRSLPSMVHIEMLLLLHRTAPRAWTAEQAAMELRSSPELVVATIADLLAARLAEPEPGSTLVRLRAEDDLTMAAVVALKEVYDRRPVTLIKALYRRPAASVQAFADAFRLR